MRDLSETKLHERIEQSKGKGKRGVLKFLFGRSTLVAVSVVGQAILFIAFLARWQYSLAAYGISYAVAAFMGFFLINRPMSGAGRATWLTIMLLSPIVGTVLFLYIENDAGHRMVQKRLADIHKSTKRFFPDKSDVFKALPESDVGLKGLASYMKQQGNFPLYENGGVRYLPSGEAKFKALLETLETAEKFIFLEYFIIGEGVMWDTILEILKRKVKAGVEVRLLYDGTCTYFRLPHDYPKTMESYGIQCRMFAPIHPIVSTYYNNRDHRKILVIDGKIAYTGGINLSDEYINKKQIHGRWKDCAVEVRGEAVDSFTLMFLQMWSVAGTQEKDYGRYLIAEKTGKRQGGYILPYGDDPFSDERVGESVYLDILNRAEHYVHIMTPYLIIGESMVEALKFAAKRGVDVRIILPHVPDKKSAFALAYTHYKEMLTAGVKLYEYTPGFVHSKAFVSDDRKAVVGTVNLDHRSLSLHFECAAYMYDVPIIGEIEQDFRTALKDCSQVTLDSMKHEKLSRKVLGYLLKPLAPLM
ncbi:MAG: cardiolipin synthase [Clostridia bacterium]|nr:cardiolipin synthase [Clostridia bacterium]